MHLQKFIRVIKTMPIYICLLKKLDYCAFLAVVSRRLDQDKLLSIIYSSELETLVAPKSEQSSFDTTWKDWLSRIVEISVES